MICPVFCFRSWRWIVVAGAFRVKTNKHTWFPCFCKGSCIFEVFTTESKIERLAGKERELGLGEQQGKKNKLQKCEALELKLCLPGPTESR